MAYPALLRLTTPRTFLYLMSLRTGTELITLTLIFNKVSGLYGMLALLTGFHLSSLQLSMYIYSLVALILTAILSPHIRQQSPLQCLMFAWLYLIDSIINAAYTAAFGIGWFIVLAQHNSPSDNSKHLGPGGKMMGDVAGFTDPAHNVNEVEVVPGEDTLIGHGDGSRQAAGGGLNDTLLQSGSILSIAVISTLWAIRIYFILVVLAYARGVLRQYIVASSQTSQLGSGSKSTADMAENPFAEGKELGGGWRGQLGRLMVSIGRTYWLGADESGDWERSIGGRFASRRTQDGSPASKGLVERERRRRAGTGPPQLRPIELSKVRNGREA